MKREQAYEFRKKLLTVHEKDVRDYTKVPGKDMLVLETEMILELAEIKDEVVHTAAVDFLDFLKTSMGINGSLSYAGQQPGKGIIRLAYASAYDVDLKEAAGYKGFLIEVNDGIEIYGYDARGIAAALFYLEDLMCMEHAPYVKKGAIRKKPMFAPSMVHSGYGMEEWPDEYLMRIAHEGRDALLVFTKDVNETRVGFLDFNDLITRAAKYGIDVYAYSFLISGRHPDEPDAEAYYENTYGRLFRECPGLAGVTLVGEAVEFDSKDPHVSQYLYGGGNADGLPDGKPWPGWYPCEDLPKWLELIKKIIRRQKESADIVLWTYNWGFQPEDARIRLIEQLPADITLLPTFEMFESWKIGESTIAGSDYTLTIPGPGKYFASEAAAAKKRGIKLYTMSQCAGLTWDFGVVPYEPMPYQWMKRYKAMVKAKEDWGLCGGMDCHHHGFYPSIISKFSKHAFLEPAEPMEDILNRILTAEYGEENLAAVQEGFRLWSEAICYYTPTEGDFCCASRVGPSYPFNLFYQATLPCDSDAMFGSVIVGTKYHQGQNHFKIDAEPEESVLNLRIHEEIKSLEIMLDYLKQGVNVFEAVPQKNEKLLSVINLGKFIALCVKTNIDAKHWHILKCKLSAAFEKESLYRVVADMEELLKGQIKVAEAAIPLVEMDSRLGWEPSMHYLTDKAHLEWKIRQVEFVLKKELVKYKKCIER